jgi:hypothetical protein
MSPISPLHVLSYQPMLFSPTSSSVAASDISCDTVIPSDTVSLPPQPCAQPPWLMSGMTAYGVDLPVPLYVQLS